MLVGLSNMRTAGRMEIADSGQLARGLAYGLLLMVLREERYICVGCAHPYIRKKRAPRKGQENLSVR